MAKNFKFFVKRDKPRKRPRKHTKRPNKNRKKKKYNRQGRA